MEAEGSLPYNIFVEINEVKFMLSDKEIDLYQEKIAWVCY